MVAAGKSRAEIRDQQIALAEAEIAKFDSMTDEEYKATKFDLVGHKG